MLPYLASLFQELWGPGPFRLFESSLVLICLGTGLSLLLVGLLLPRLLRWLPRDSGKVWVAQGEEAKGKPTGGGMVIVVLLLPVLFLVLPFSAWRQWVVVGCLVAVMITGFLDDVSRKEWGQLVKGLLDLTIAFLTSLALCWGKEFVVWWPFFKGSPELQGGFVLPVWAFLLIGTFVLWMAINATNCTDGIDGLAGSLVLLSLTFLGGFLYTVVGHSQIANYLLLPHNRFGAQWAILIASVSGGFAGYLWHNAKPSRVLMGDAGSRFLGLLIGVAVLAAGNPVLILVVAPVIMINGASGLAKLILLRVMGRFGFDVTPPHRRDEMESPPPQHVLVRALHSVRFPLHDHCRRKLGWSDPQVLVRFMLLQAFLTPILFVLLVKIR